MNKLSKEKKLEKVVITWVVVLSCIYLGAIIIALATKEVLIINYKRSLPEQYQEYVLNIEKEPSAPEELANLFSQALFGGKFFEDHELLSFDKWSSQKITEYKFKINDFILDNIVFAPFNLVVALFVLILFASFLYGLFFTKEGKIGLLAFISMVGLGVLAAGSALVQSGKRKEEERLEREAARKRREEAIKKARDESYNRTSLELDSGNDDDFDDDDYKP